jgi:mono/diheme cytochrome c family protein
MTYAAVRRCIVLVAFASSILALAGWSAAISAQNARSVRDGVYTAEQGERGERVYRADCASCHGTMLEGGGQAPPLTDQDFVKNWSGLALADLFERIQKTMPADRPGQMSRDRTADVLAFLLNANKLPAGPRDLPAAADALSGIRFDAPQSR